MMCLLDCRLTIDDILSIFLISKTEWKSDRSEKSNQETTKSKTKYELVVKLP